ncbi:MAG: hypothetical protein COV74_01990 [Candidatus Omnitrophica bacterium CG11_big_fil_rev_8_21_14_0_20_45_26]|uniref:Lipoprotein n=1 Tax=Candidatus Abzuiibacterium crystallinum TaxID=1974748 RepID=A0A2H0LS01_9BACT|nr:MAG: hypothetical protein COV74_01990 [Candidatus Omnitrophica bacterium CG11_big_fil_rev_8_21_14_0_20_45_26]PIW65337.1 MAG: hypothetical protein COW12_02395 [Candidatus Omnitrophica bacterium CG12_big_fil_rev_8_21_14_0_65_45_16]
MKNLTRTKLTKPRTRASFFYFLLAGMLLFSAGCATPYLKGVTPAGEKVYVGPLPIENTEAFQTFLHSSKTEVDKQLYLFQRLKAAMDLEYYHDGSWYSWLETYRGGTWLIRNRYKKDQDTRDFLRKHVWHSETTGKLHLVRFPDGSIQIGYFLLLNELDLLEAALQHEINKN